MVIDLNMPAPTGRTRRWWTAPAPAALVLAAVVVTPAATWLATRPLPAAVHTVQVGVSTYPAPATAQWTDRQGASHTLDPWADNAARVPAHAVVVAVQAPAGGQVQCSLVVDGATQDTATAANGAIALCEWTE